MRHGHAQRVQALIACLLLPLGARSAEAETFTFYFEGYIDFVHDYLELDESVHLGAPFTGGYTFDPGGATDDSPNPSIGSYYFGSAGRMWAQIGNYQFATNTLGILIVNDRPDAYEPISFSVLDTGGYQWSVMSILLVDETRTALDSDALVTTVPDLAAFEYFHGFGIELPGSDLGIGGVLTSLTPEPSSLGLLSLGALVFCLRRNW